MSTRGDSVRANYCVFVKTHFKLSCILQIRYHIHTFTATCKFQRHQSSHSTRHICSPCPLSCLAFHLCLFPCSLCIHVLRHAITRTVIHAIPICQYIHITKTTTPNVTSTQATQPATFCSLSRFMFCSRIVSVPLLALCSPFSCATQWHSLNDHIPTTIQM